MKKILFCLCTLMATTVFVNGQTTDYKVVFDMTSRDTINQQSLIRELGLIMDGNPEARLEVVLYGQGLDIVMKDRSKQQAAVQKLIAGNHVSFKACAIAMKRQNIEPSALITGVEMVPDGIYEIISKQRGGWGYIKVSH